MLRLVPDTHADSVFLVIRKNGTSYITHDKGNLFAYIKSCSDKENCVIESVTEFCSFNISWIIEDDSGVP